LRRPATSPRRELKGSRIWRLTSKQEFAAEHVAKLAREGHKIIVYVHRPHLLFIMERELLAKGIRSVSVHGGRDIEERTQDLRENFRLGRCQCCWQPSDACRPG